MEDEPLQPIPDPEEEEGGPVKTFLEHLEDLRWVLIKCFSALLLGMVTCMVAAPTIVKVLTRPLERAGLDMATQVWGPLGAVMISLKIGFYGGITLGLPLILYFIGEFVLPALKKNEKKYFFRAFLVGGGLFLVGLLICYFLMLPLSLRGLAGYAEWMNLKGDFWRAEEYFSFVLLFMVGMGLAFEIPVIILTLVRVGVISHEALVKGRAYFFVGNLVLCAFITPDFISTIPMVLCVQVLMEGCILISKHWERQKRLAEAAAAAQSKRVESGIS